MEKRHYDLLARLRASVPVALGGEDAVVASELYALGLVEGVEAEAIDGGSRFSFVFEGVTGEGIRALGEYAHRRRNLALRFLGWLGRAVLARLGL